MLELALWKMNIDASSTDNGVAMGDNNRLECRTNCGADFVIENVLPYLLPSDFVCSLPSDFVISDEEDSYNINNDEGDDYEDELDNNSISSDEDDDNNDDGWEE